MKKFPEIESVYTLPDHRLLVAFQGDRLRVYDCAPLLAKPAFRPLAQETLFAQVQVGPDGHGVLWNDEIDLSESELWLNGKDPQLFKTLTTEYKLDSLKTLGHLLGVPSDEIGPPTRTAYARELIEYCRRRGLYSDLFQKIENREALLGNTFPPDEQREKISFFFRKGRVLLSCTFYVAVAFGIVVFSSFFINQIRLILVEPTPTPTPTITASPTLPPTSEPAPEEPTEAPAEEPTEEASSGDFIQSTPGQTIIGCEVNPPSGWVEYSVSAGDTIESLAVLYDVVLANIAEPNCLDFNAILESGQIIWVPPCAIEPPQGWGIYRVQSGDTISTLAEGFGTTTSAVTDVNCLTSTVLRIDQEIWLPNVIEETPTLQP